MRKLFIALCCLGQCVCEATGEGAESGGVTESVEIKRSPAWFEVRETAGIRRRQDVVHTRLRLASAAAKGTRFRLLLDDTPVACQFRPVRSDAGDIVAVDMDFLAHIGPLETRRYAVEYGDDVVAVDEPASGFVLEESDERFLVSNRDRVVWDIRKDLRGLFGFLHRPELRYVRPDSAGLVFRQRDNQLLRLADRRPDRVRVLRQGPFACALQFEYADWPTGASSVVVLEFVRSKSWVHATWTIDGGEDVVEMGAELQLDLVGKEKLVDFGAGDFVYTTVTTDRVALFEAGPTGLKRGQTPWRVLHGRRGELEPIVVARTGQRQGHIGGWVHVMDERRCTAATVGAFGVSTHDRIQVEGTGRLFMGRGFSQRTSEPRKTSLEFWVHFVGVPVHIGARTSPQSMGSPLQVHWTQ